MGKSQLEAKMKDQEKEMKNETSLAQSSLAAVGQQLEDTKKQLSQLQTAARQQENMEAVKSTKDKELNQAHTKLNQAEDAMAAKEKSIEESSKKSCRNDQKQRPHCQQTVSH